MNHKIILISGKQGAGKSTLALALRDEWVKTKNNSGILVNFADGLYDMHDFCLGYLKDHGIHRDIKKDGPLLQLLGTEWGRKTIDENIWVNLLKAKVKKFAEPSRSLGRNQLFIVGDCRFPNEINLFPDALKVRLNCDRAVRKYRCTQWRENDNHESETALDSFYDYDLMFNTETQKTEDLVKIIMQELTK